MLSLLFQSGRVDLVLLDQELIDQVDRRARRLMRRGEIPRELWSHFRHKLRCWPSHRNHLHLRLRDAPLATAEATTDGA